MKMHRLVPLCMLVMVSTASAQLLPAFATQWTTTNPDPASIMANIAADAKRMQVERWRIQQDLQTKIFETTQDITVNRSKSLDLKLQAYDEYIRGDPGPWTIKNPTVQSSGKITITPASGGQPAPGDAPVVSYAMKIFLYIVGQGPSSNAAPSPIWESDVLTSTASGFGSFDYSLSFNDAAFIQTLSDTDALDVQTVFTAHFDTTNVSADDVRVVIGTGVDPYPDLPETSFSMVVVPEPMHLSGAALALWALCKRNPFRSERAW
jgi:hypothetical protein